MPRNEGSPRKGEKNTKLTPNSASSGASSKSDSNSKIMTPKSPTKKSVRSLSKGGLTADEGINLLNEMGKEKVTSSVKQKPGRTKKSKNKEEKRQSLEDEDIKLPAQADLPQRVCTKEEIERENSVLQKAEEKLEDLKVKAAEKEIIFDKLLQELKRMMYIFNKVKEIDINVTSRIELNDESKVQYNKKYPN